MEIYNELVGPKQEDQESILRDQTVDGKMLYEAFLDPQTLSWSKEEVEEAKNKLIEMQNKHPEIIQMCARKSIDECRSEIANAA